MGEKKENITIQLRETSKGIGLELSERQINSFCVYKEMLERAGKEINLTAIPKEKYVDLHFIDSLTLYQTRKIKNESSIVDIGAGAGFPALPLKIALPGLEVHLIESNIKKAEFLRQLVMRLGFQKVYIYAERAENAARRPHLRENIDIAVARAVTGLPVLLEYALPLMKIGGWFLAMKGPRVWEEMKKSEIAARGLGGRIETVFQPKGQPGVQRSIVLVEKTGKTDDVYPRRTGVPTKRPLGG